MRHARRAERDVLVKCEKPFSELKHALAASLFAWVSRASRARVVLVVTPTSMFSSSRLRGCPNSSTAQTSQSDFIE